MSDLIVGDRILEIELIKNGDRNHLKNSTYDLTIGTIVPIGKNEYKSHRKNGLPLRHYIQPREMVLVLSRESFQMPRNVTGLVTLRTTFTKVGLHALDVGIVDPHFSGPISTALINFSDRPVEIKVGEPFFRVLFLLHDDVGKWKPEFDESTQTDSYIQKLEKIAYSEFPKNYLNTPSSDDEFYFRNFWKMVWAALTYGWLGKAFGIFVVALIWFLLFETSFLSSLSTKWDFISKYWPF